MKKEYLENVVNQILVKGLGEEVVKYLSFACDHLNSAKRGENFEERIKSAIECIEDAVCFYEEQKKYYEMAKKEAK